MISRQDEECEALRLNAIWAVCLSLCFWLEMLRTTTAVCAQWPRRVGKSKPGSVSWGRYAGNSVGLQSSQSPSHIKD